MTKIYFVVNYNNTWLHIHVYVCPFLFIYSITCKVKQHKSPVKKIICWQKHSSAQPKEKQSVQQVFKSQPNTGKVFYKPPNTIMMMFRLNVVNQKVVKTYKKCLTLQTCGNECSYHTRPTIMILYRQTCHGICCDEDGEYQYRYYMESRGWVDVFSMLKYSVI